MSNSVASFREIMEGEMIHRKFAGFQNDFIAAFGEHEQAVRFRRKIFGSDLAGEFSFGVKHGGMCQS